MKKLCSLVLIFISTLSISKAQQGAIDPTFNTTDAGFGSGDGANSNVLASAVQVDGKILIGGLFTTYNGVSKNYLLRLNSDGSIDAGFNPGVFPNGPVQAIVIQPDGKILIGGQFTTYGPASLGGIARLNTDGTADITFNPGAGVDAAVRTIALQADGKILIGGDFTDLDGTPVGYLARLNANGSIDATYNNVGSGADNFVYTIALQPDGKAIIGGSFTDFNGSAVGRVARLNTDGSVDGSFSATGANNTVLSIALQADGKIILGGQFSTFDGVAKGRIARANSDGSNDGSFTGTGSNANVIKVLVQSDGKILVAGSFTTFNGSLRNRITRLNTDGNIDSGFNIGTGANLTISSLSIQTDGKIIIGGLFLTYNGISMLRIGRLNTDGTRDNLFNPITGSNASVSSVAFESSGKMIIAGSFTVFNGVSRNRVARINTDGTIDPTFNPGTGATGLINAAALQSDGKVLLGGGFTNFNGSSASDYLVRLLADGTVDNTFSGFSGANNVIRAILVQSDGKILIGGDLTVVNGSTRNFITRLNADGSIDNTFSIGLGFDGAVYDLGIQSDGKIIVAGNFTNYNGTARNHLVRLNSDGSLDNTFTSAGGANGIIHDITVQADDKIIIAGEFTTYNGSTRTRIARLDASGTVEATFTSPIGANATIFKTAAQTDGKILIGGAFTTFAGVSSSHIARLNTDGSLDNTFLSGTAADNTVNVVALQPADNKIIIGGSFTSYNGTGKNRIARLLNADPLLEWTGITSNAWNTASNWSTNAVPTSAGNPIIPNVGANFYPVITSGVEVSSINVQNGANLTIASGGSLSLSGTLTNNGTVTVQNGGVLLQTSASVMAGTGSYSIQRNLPTANRFHYIGSPVNNVGVNAFGIVPSAFNGSDGNQLVPQSTCSASSLEIGSPWCNLLELRENASVLSNCSQSLWHIKSAGNLTNGRGYAAMAYGTSTTNLSFNGTINNGTILYNGLTSTAGTVTDPLSGTINRGWHLVSNPYPSPITFGANNADLSSQGFGSQVQIWNAASGTWIPTVSNSLIPVGQGFQIRNTNVGTTPGLQFTNNLRTLTAGTFYELPWEQFLTVTMENNQHNMQTVIFFHEEATDAYDYTLEANRLFGDMEVPVIYTLAGSETEKMAFNGYAPLYNESKTVVMGVYDGSTPGSFTLRFQDLNTLPNISVTLEDTKLNTVTSITEGFVYNFTTAAGDDRNRFRVHFSMLEDAFIGTQTQNLFSVYPNPTDDRMNISFSDASQAYTISLRDLSGKTLLNTRVHEGTQNMQVDAQGFASGVYLLEVRSASGERNVVKLIKK